MAAQDGDILKLERAAGSADAGKKRGLTMLALRSWIEGWLPKPRNEIEASGRIYCYNDARWVTSGDDNYGANYYQWLESGGTGDDPLQEWEHRGHLVRQGTVLDNVIMLCRILDINTIADMEILVSFTDPQGRWYSGGIDADSEDTHTEIYRGFWKAGGGGQDPRTVTLNDRYARKIDLGQFVAPADGELRFYFKPVNMDPRPNTTTDYCQISYNVETFG